MVLNDDETYTSLTGCKIVAVDSEIDDSVVDVMVKDVANGLLFENSYVVTEFREYD